MRIARTENFTLYLGNDKVIVKYKHTDYNIIIHLDIENEAKKHDTVYDWACYHIPNESFYVSEIASILVDEYTNQVEKHLK